MVSVLIMIFNDLTRLPIYRQIKPDTSDNSYHPCGCCCSADAYNPFDHVGANEETKEGKEKKIAKFIFTWYKDFGCSSILSAESGIASLLIVVVVGSLFASIKWYNCIY